MPILSPQSPDLFLSGLTPLLFEDRHFSSEQTTLKTANELPRCK